MKSKLSKKEFTDSIRDMKSELKVIRDELKKIEKERRNGRENLTG